MRTLRRALGVVAVGAGLVSGLTGCARGEAGESTVEPTPPEDDQFQIGPPQRLQELITAETPPPPLSGGTLAVSKDGTLAVAADPDRDLVYLVAPATRSKQTLKLPKGSEPGRVAIDAANRAHVALRGTGKVISVNPLDATVIAETDVCTSPRGISYDASKDALVVACVSGELITLSAATLEKTASLQLERDLRDVVVGAGGSLSVSRYRSAELVRVSANGDVLGSRTAEAQKQSRFVFEDDGSGEVQRKPSSGVGTTTTVTLSAALAWKTVGAADGTTLMLHQASQDDEVVIQSSGGYGGGCQTITQASLTYFNADGTPQPSVGLSPHGLVVDVASSPDGRWIALAEPGGYLQGNPTFELIAKSSLSTSVGAVDAGLPPASVDAGRGADAGPVDAGVTFPRDPTFPSLDGGLGGAVTCMGGSGGGADIQATSVAFDDTGTLFVFSREPAELLMFEPEPEDNDNMFGGWAALIERDRITLASSSVRDTGHDLFHADVGSGLSCAGCHGEALDDGHVWNFRDFGPRRTQTMRGGLLSTLPLHWEGDLPDFKHLVDEVMTRRMGGFTVEEKYAGALAKWIDHLPPLKLGASEAGPADAVQRGKALYESKEVACATCHNGSHFTNNKSVDVGTGGVFQVPTLLGLALHPPFLHDGCANTLAERFEPGCGGGDKHGHTSQLSDSEIADLVSYLNTL